MAKELKLPELGENIESADVVSVLVKAGDKVEKEQGVIEIETDKATVEVPSSVSGTIEEVLVKQGDKIKVGQVILKLSDSDGEEKEKESNESKKEEAADKEKKEEKKVEEKEVKGKIKEETKEVRKEEKKPADKKKAEGKIIEMKLPELGENIETADIINILINVGDDIVRDQGVLEIETDKATIEVPSTVNGKVIEILVKQGEKAKVGQTLFKIETVNGVKEKEEERPKDEKRKEVKAYEGEKSEKKKVDEKDETGSKGERELHAAEKPEQQPPITQGAAPAAPSVRRIAREIGIDINKVPGSGPGGRISMDDVKAFAKKLNEGRSSKTSIGVKAETLPDFSKFGDIERKSMSNIRGKTADHLSYAWVSIPHVTQHDKADITELEKLRKTFNPNIEKVGGKLTVTAILLKVITSALKVFPQFNCSIDMNKHEVIYKKYYNIGIAVDTDRGLIVPVIKDADKKNITELSIEMSALAEKARNRKISLEELQGGCFTITNLGGIGGTSFTPIVNSPEVAILGVSRGSYEPVYSGGEFEPRLMLPLSLSYDHRIIDGADAARFLRWVCEALEQPMKLLVEG